MDNPKLATVLTNLQRGNVKQESPMLSHQRTVHELAAQGELYDLGSRVADTVDGDNMTPLLWAAGYGQNSTVEFLLERGANVNHKANSGQTALMLAATKGFHHVVKTLINTGADVNALDNSGNSALMFAAHQDHPLVIHELLRAGADLSLASNCGQTAYSISLSRSNRSSQNSIETHLFNLLRTHDTSQKEQQGQAED